MTDRSKVWVIGSPRGRWSLLGLGAFVCIWAFLAVVLDNPRRYPPPSALVVQVGDVWSDPQLLLALLTSLRRVLLGFMGGSALGILLAIAVGLWRPLSIVFDPVVELLRPIPALGVLPIFLVILGIGEALPISVVAYIAFFPAYVATLDGLHSVETTHLEAARTLGADRWMTVRDVLMPAAAPRMFAGLRIAMALSWMSIIGAEMVGTTSGIGFSIMFFRQFAQTNRILMGMLLIGLAGAALDAIMRRIERRVSPWLVSEDA